MGVRPVVHWSESAPDKRANAHSDYVTGPISLHGMEDQVRWRGQGVRCGE